MIFVKIWRTIKKIDAKRNFFTWYYAILKNSCLNDIRKNSDLIRNYSEFSDQNLEEVQDYSTDVSGSLEKEEKKQTVWKAINELKENDREILMLREFQDLSYLELSEILNCPQGTVMSRLYSARKALKERLKKYLKNEILS